jgi:hypothetical protein
MGGSSLKVLDYTVSGKKIRVLFSDQRKWILVAKTTIIIPCLEREGEKEREPKRE